MKTVFRVALVATLFVSSCLAQKGTVTFYTPGNSVKSTTASLLSRSQQPFTGWLFDGPQPLAHVQSLLRSEGCVPEAVDGFCVANAALEEP